MSSFSLAATYRNTGVLTVTGDLSLSIFPKNTSQAVVTGDIVGNIYFRNTGAATISGVMGSISSGPFAGSAGRVVSGNFYASQRNSIVFSGTVSTANFSGTLYLKNTGQISASGDAGLPYLFRSQFLTTVPAPITNPYAAEIGGNWVTTDAESKLFTLLSRLRGGGQNTPVWGDEKLVSAGFARAQGRCYAALITLEDAYSDIAVGFNTANNTADPRTNGYGWVVENGNLEVIYPSVKVVLDAGGKAVHSMQYYLVIALQSTGAYVLLSTFANDTNAQMLDQIGIPQYPAARLLWVDQLDSTATLYPYLSFYDLGAGSAYPNGQAVEDVRLIDSLDSSYNVFNGLSYGYDQFTDPDGTLLSAHTANKGGNYSFENSGTWEINTNQARLKTASGGYDLAYLGSVTQSDGCYQWRFTIPGTLPVFGFGIRHASNTNYIRITNLGVNNLQIGKVVSNVYTAFLAAGFTWTLGQTYTLTLFVKGNKYLPLIDGVVIGGGWTTDAGNNFLTAGGFGIVQVGVTNRVLFDSMAFYPSTPTLPLELQQGAIPSVLAGGATLGQDSFTGVNGTHLNVHVAEAGGAWTERVGSWTINASNQATVSLAAGTNFATQSLGTSNIECSLDVITPGVLPTPRALAGIVFRFVDINNWMMARIFKDVSQPGADEIELHECIGGVDAVVHKSLLGTYFTTSQTTNLKVQAKNDLVQVFYAGFPIISYYTQAGSPLGTNHGLYRQGSPTADDGCVFDNWLAKQL